ncbi:MAG: 1-deoxy-D-xylulose-5-phosphate synthase, partial [bacterium]
NLGVVELTLALHRVFDTSRDRLIFDVGHQSYVHKLLTGRGGAFPTLRQYGGLSGFPKPSESIHDAFIAGHASAAVSEALGMARARTLLGEDYAVIALLGDGALTGGLAYEGMCDAGASKEPLIVILNDNGMSISGNVGGMAKYLSSLRLRRGYRKFKDRYRRFTERVPGGKFLYRLTHQIKASLKRAIYDCEMFEDWGFQYIGPVDGHDLEALTRALEVARDIQAPALVHVITTKGRGYAPAEENPELFHGIGKFDPATGIPAPTAPSFAGVFGEQLVSLAEVNRALIAVTAAMAPGTGLAHFKERFPERFFDVGIAEGHAASLCAGAAHQGLTPVFAVYSTFLQRAYDMLLHDIGILGEHVVLAVDKCGLSGEDGETHQGIFDISYLRSVPGMTVLSPASFQELRDMLTYAVLSCHGPVAVRYPKGGEGAYKAGGAVPSSLLREGEDFTLVTYGTSVNDALAAADTLAAEGIGLEVIKLGFLKPWDTDAVERSVRKTGRLLVL